MKRTLIILLAGFLLVGQACTNKKVEETPEAVAADDAAAEPAEEAPKVEASASSDTKPAEATKPSNTYIDDDGSTVYKLAEVQPVYVGGEDDMKRFMKSNLKYPDTDAEGTVYISFVVAKDGKVRSVKVENGVEDELLRNEAIRVVSAMPPWTPGSQGGKVVNVKHTLPITFKK